WMRDRVPPVFRHARRYWAQEFIDVRPRLAEAGPNAAVVGPIVAPSGPDPGGRGPRLVVELGGRGSPPGWDADDLGYFDLVVRGLVESGWPAAAGPGAVLLAGERCARYLRSRYPGCGLEMVSAAHEEALALLRAARWVVTAPGLTACLECF